MIGIVVALELLKLTGLDGQVIEVSPSQIVSIRAPRGGLHEQVHCLIHTTDGKFITVIESCEEVQQRLERLK